MKTLNIMRDNYRRFFNFDLWAKVLLNPPALSLAFLAVISFYIFLFLKMADHSLPAASDEYLYYLESKNFYENNSLVSVFTFDGKSSLIGNFGLHGFAYGFLHGAIAKIFGFHVCNIFYANFSFTLLAFLIIFLSKKLNITQKLQLTLLISTYFVAVLFTFSFMQEGTQLFFSVLAGLLLYKIYYQQNQRTSLVIMYIASVFLISLFRVSCFVWILALFPLAENLKQRISFILFFFIVVILALLYGKYFYSRSYNFYWFSLNERDFFGSIIWFGRNFLKNCIKYLSFPKPNLLKFDLLRYEFILNFFSKYVLLLVLILAIYYAIKEKNKYFSGISLTILASFAALFFLYDIAGGERHLAPAFYFLYTGIVINNKKRIFLILFLVQILFFPLAIKQTILWAHVYQANYVKFQSSAGKQLSDSLSAFRETMVGSKSLLVQMPPCFFYDSEIGMMLLPLRNSQNFPITYSTNPKLQFDYIISLSPLSRPHYQLVKKNDLFLYKLIAE